MKEAKYATDKYTYIHIGLSTLIAVGVIAFAVKHGHVSIANLKSTIWRSMSTSATWHWYCWPIL